MNAFLKRLFIFFFILLILAATLVAFLPSIASTDWGRKQVIHWVNSSIPGKVEIHALELAWTSGQNIEGLLLTDPQGHSVLQVERLSTEATLWQLLRKSTHLGYTQIVDLNASIQTNEKGLTNLHTALGLEQNTPVPVHLFPSNTIISDVNIDLHLFSKGNPLSAYIKGTTKQDKLNGSFEVNLALQALEASNWSELKNDVQQYLTIEGSKEAKIHANIVNFPIDLIDRLVALSNPRWHGLFLSLFGDRLNLLIDKEPSSEGLIFNLSAQSPQMQGHLKGKIAKGLVSMQETGNFQFQLTPELINSFAIDRFKLLNPTILKVIIPTVTLPLNILDSDASLDPCDFEFKAQLELPKTEVDLPDVGLLSLFNFHTIVNAPACSKIVECHISGKAGQKLEAFDFDIKATLPKPEDWSYSLYEIFRELKTQVSISHFPLQLIPEIRHHPEFLEISGPTLDAQLAIRTLDDDHLEGILDLHTSKVHLKDAVFHVSDDLTLIKPAEIELTLPKNCLSKVFDNNEFLTIEPCPVSITLKKLHLKLKDLKYGKFQIETLVPKVIFPKLSIAIEKNNQTSGYNVGIQNLVLNVEGDNFSRFSTNLTGYLSRFHPDTEVSLENPLQISVSSQWEVGKDKQFEMPLGVIELKNAIMQAKMEGKLSSTGKLDLTQVSQIHYLLKPRVFHSQLSFLELLIFQTPKSRLTIPELRDNSSINLSIYPFSVDLKSFTLANLNVKGELLIDHIHFEDSSGVYPNLEKIELPWEFNGPANYVAADLKGLINTPAQNKSSPFSAHFQQWLNKGAFDPQTQTEVQINFENMPTALLPNHFSTDLGPLLGPVMDLHLKTFIDPTHEKPGYIDFSVDSAHLHAQGRFKLNDAASIYEESKIPNFRLDVTPESFEFLKHLAGVSDSLALAQPVTIFSQLTQFDIPLKEKNSKRAQIDFIFTAADIKWKNVPGKPLKLDGRIQSANLFKEMQFQLKADAENLLTLNGTLLHPLKPNGKINELHEIEIQAAISGNKLSPMYFQNLLLGNQMVAKKVKALFGDSVDLLLKCQLTGTNGIISASVSGPEAGVNFDGRLKDGIVTLNQPIEGFFNLTPLFIQTYLAPNVSLLSSATGSEKPIQFTLSNEQFSCPIFPFKLDQLKVGKGMLDLGKIRFKNEGELSSILNFVHKISEPYFTLWFTPLYFNLDKGQLTLNRMDLLVANSYPLAIWGTMNLNKQEGDLILGLSAQSLQYAFGIQGLDDQYVLQVPLHLSKGKVDVDKKKATARITALIAQSQGGVNGKIFGGILDAALSGGEIAPAPTTKPFPWKDDLPNRPNAIEKKVESSPDLGDKPEKKKKKKKKHKNEDPEISLKDIEQGAVQILDSLFKP